MGALAVHNLAAKIHGIKNKVQDATKTADPSLIELRAAMAEAYAELATTAKELELKNRAKVAAAAPAAAR